MTHVLGPVTLGPQLSIPAGPSCPFSIQSMARVSTRKKLFSLSCGACPSSGYCRVALMSMNSVGSQHFEAGAWKVWS